MGSIYKRGKVWWLKYYVDGRALYESARTPDHRVASDLLKEREVDIAKGRQLIPSQQITFRELAQDVVDDYKINGRRSLPEQEIRLRLHILPAFGNRRAASIGPADIKKYIVKRLEEDASNATINRELGLIRRAFNLAIENQKVAAKPLIRMLKEANVRQGFFEREQFQAVRKHLQKELHPMLTIFYVTGWRFSEILGLRWHQVDFEAERLYLEPGTTKNDEARLFPFTDALRGALTAQKDYTDRVSGASMALFVPGSSTGTAST